jgi:hypothetical protein
MARYPVLLVLSRCSPIMKNARFSSPEAVQTGNRPQSLGFLCFYLRTGGCIPRHNMSTAHQIARLREATGMGWLEARLFLAGRPAELCERIVTAKERQKDGILHDPIEDEPAFAQQFADAKKKAEETFRAWVASRNAEYRNQGLTALLSEHPRGGCHFVWREMKKVLQDQHGIKWFTPAEMNPGTKFD